MGTFDKMFGQGAANAPAEAEHKFMQLKEKYQSVLNAIEQQNLKLQNLHVEGDKLFIRGAAPSEQAREAIWSQIKLVDPINSDLITDISVEAPKRRAAVVGGAASNTRIYTVKAGDSLEKISQKFYGSSHEFMRIFYANRDKLSDPDTVKEGQELIIPPD